MGRTRLRTAVERTQAFTDSCTTPTAPAHWRLTIGEGYTEPDRALDARVADQFGPGTQVPIPAERGAEAVSFMEEIQQQPPQHQVNARYWLQVFLNFAVRDPATGDLLAGQDPQRFHHVVYEGWSGQPLGTSGLTLSLNRSAALSLNLCLPGVGGQRLTEITRRLQGHLPVRLSAKHWKLWTPTRTGSFKGRNIPSPLA